MTSSMCPGPALRVGRSGRWFGEGTGIAIRKQDNDLEARFNAAVRAIRAGGTYDDTASRYCDFDVYGEEIA